MAKDDTSTTRLYMSAQKSFTDWWNDSVRRRPNPTMADVAAYLRICAQTRGPHAAIVHLSAIAALFRENDLAFDTKDRAIQAVIQTIREVVRPAQGMSRVDRQLAKTLWSRATQRPDTIDTLSHHELLLMLDLLNVDADVLRSLLRRLDTLLIKNGETEVSPFTEATSRPIRQPRP
jgi:hypothetical protein